MKEITSVHNAAVQLLRELQKPRARRENGLYKEARVYVGTLGAAARRCAGAEAALAASDFAQKLPEELCGLAAKAIPGRSTLPYKQSALRALAQDICVLLGRRAEEAGCR